MKSNRQAEKLKRLKEELKRLEIKADIYSRTDWEIYELYKEKIKQVNEEILDVMTDDQRAS